VFLSPEQIAPKFLAGFCDLDNDPHDYAAFLSGAFISSSTGSLTNKL
jgi:hypothetical protein